MAFVTVDGATISFETDPSAKVGDLWSALTQREYPCDYYCLTYGSQEVDNERLIADFGENLVLKLEIRPEIKPRWDEFWATSQENLNEYPVGHPIRVAFEANIWSQKLEFLAIMKHAATGDFSSATIANDYYKLAMAAVIRQAINDKGDIVVSFALNLRTPGLEKKLAANKDSILDDVINALSRFQERFFNRDIISATVEGRSIQGFWRENLDEICGSKVAPRSIIRGEKISPESDYWPGTCIYNRKAGPADVRDREVVLSVFFKDGKLHIEATGPWNKCTFLETPMMQAVYQVLLDHHLHTRGVSFGHWLYEALFREHLSCAFAMEACPKMKGALFAGRRTGHHIFTLFQTWYASRYYPNCIGTSSFDAWHTLAKVLGMQHIVPPVGTHAHELSMVFMCLYPELDQNSEGIQFSQVLAHYMFYRLVHQGYSGTSPMPMLPDTLGTPAFMKAAENTLVTPMLNGVPQTQHQQPFLSLLNSARQDSGSTGGFKKILEDYPTYKGSMMASEISKCADLEKARDEGYASFGAGGFMGDSETVWSVTTDPFSVSMAVKPVCVYVDGVRTVVQPVKLGDGDGKATCDATLTKEEQEIILRNANIVKQAAIDAPHGFTRMSINENFDCSFMEVNKKFKKE
jgi:nicotinic acid phosphoribosyltransferase